MGRAADSASGVRWVFNAIRGIARREPHAPLNGTAAQLGLFAEQAPVAMAMFDRDMRYIAASRRWNADYGLGETNLAGRSHYEVFPGTPERWKELHRRALAGETLREEHDSFTRDDGRVQWVRWEMWPWRAADGSAGGIFIATENLTAKPEASQTLSDKQEELNRVEEELVRLQRLTQLIGERAAHPIFVTDARGCITYANPEARRTFGFGSGEIMGKVLHDLLHRHYGDGTAIPPDGCPMSKFQERRAIVCNHEDVFFRKDGSPVQVSCSYAPLEQDSTDSGGLFVVRDIGAQKAAEAALRESEERLRLSNEAAGIGSFTIDLEAGRAHYSPEFAAIVGFPGVRTAGIEEAFARVHRDDVARVRVLYEAAIRSEDEERLKIDFRLVRPGGEIRWLTWLGRIYFRLGPEGRAPFRIAGACVDITGRKRAENALRESEERFRGIFERAATGIAITDLRGDFQLCNPAYSAMLGYSCGELCALHFPDLVHPEDREANTACLRQLLAGEVASFEIVNRCTGKDGRIIWVHKHVSLLRDAAGAPTSILALVTDITERKRHEEQFRLLLREVNHRSKNLLTLVHAVARQTLAADPDEFITRFGERLQALAASQDLLIKSGWKGVDLDALVRSQLAYCKDLIGSRIEIRGPPLFVSASAAQTIGMAVHELATNAGKYGALSSGKGEIRIEWRLFQKDGTERFQLVWAERGGPAVSPPERSGFGTTVIEAIPSTDLDAEVTLDYAPEGLRWCLECAAGNVLESPAGSELG
ncbi:MAG: PAS domain S-box protein [Rhodomicrobium sp.]